MHLTVARHPLAEKTSSGLCKTDTAGLQARRYRRPEGANTWQTSTKPLETFSKNAHVARPPCWQQAATSSEKWSEIDQPAGRDGAPQLYFVSFLDCSREGEIKCSLLENL